MRRGTTPTIRFKVNNLPTVSTISDLWVDFENKGSYKIVVHKGIDDVTIDGTTKIVSVSLSEEETLLFRMNVICQLKMLLTNGKVAASSVIEIPIGEILNTNVMGGD